MANKKSGKTSGTKSQQTFPTFAGDDGVPNNNTLNTARNSPLPGQIVEPKLAIPFERRRAQRKPTTGGAMAVFGGGESAAGTLTRVELVDTSFHGLCIKSPVKVHLGSNVSIIPDSAAAPRQVGVVVRCDFEDGAFMLGLQCRLAKAAA